MLNRPVQPAAAPDASIGAASGSPEFGGAISTASMESNMSASAAKADVMGAHQYFQGATGAESGLLGKMEITGLAPAGDSSVTAALIAKVNEAISPVIGMIMKLPGALGFMHSLFEVLGSFLLGNFNLFEMLNPMMLGQQAAASFSKIGETLGTSLGTNLSLLPGHAPIFESAGSAFGTGMSSGFNFHSTGDFLSMKLNTSISGAPLNQMRLHETFGQKLNGIGSMNKPMFEQSSNFGHGTLSGPTLSGHSMAEQMAGHSRLFSDSLMQSGKALSANTNSLNTVSSLNSPNSLNSFANNANSGLSAEMPKFDTSANSQITFQDAGYKMSSQSLDSSLTNSAAEVGPSGRVADALSQNKIASGFNQSPFANSNNGAAQAASTNSNAVTGLKAKQLSFESLAKEQIKPQADVSVAKAASNSASSLKPQLAEAPKHIEVPKHVEAPKLHHPQRHIDAPKVHHAPKVHARVEAPKPHLAEAPKVSEMAREVKGEVEAYTIQKGDNLWNLAKDHLGDGNRWNEIYALNKDLIGSNPNLIHAGSHLNIPGAHGSEIANTASSTSYTVQPGDNLWNVSKKFLGEGKNWGEIYNMNKDVIGSNPGLIRPGQQLQIGSGNETLAGAPESNAMAPSIDGSQAQAQGIGNELGAQNGAGAHSQMQAPDAQMQPANQSEAMTPEVESMAPADTASNTIGSANVNVNSVPGAVGSASQATTIANTQAYNNAGAVHAASLSKDLKSLFGS